MVTLIVSMFASGADRQLRLLTSVFVSDVHLGLLQVGVGVSSRLVAGRVADKATGVRNVSLGEPLMDRVHV